MQEQRVQDLQNHQTRHVIYKLHRRSEWEQHLHARLEIWCVRYNAGSVAYSMSAKQKAHYTSEWTVTSPTSKKKLVAFHFNQPGHSLEDLEVMAIEKIHWGDNTPERQRKLLDIWASHLESTLMTEPMATSITSRDNQHYSTPELVF